MKKILTITVIMFAAIGLLFGTVSITKAQDEDEEQATDSGISILDYSLKPVGYVSENRFVESKWNIELKNNEETKRSFNIKIKFYDEDNNELTEVSKKAKIKGGQTKEYSDSVLLIPATAEKIRATKAFVEDVK